MISTWDNGEDESVNKSVSEKSENIDNKNDDLVNTHSFCKI